MQEAAVAARPIVVAVVERVALVVGVMQGLLVQGLEPMALQILAVAVVVDIVITAPLSPVERAAQGW